MTITRRSFLHAAGVAAAATILPSQSHAQTLRKVTFTQAWLPDGSNMFIYAAKNKGYFRKRGIDLDISRGFGSVAASQAVGAGKFDFGMAAVAAGMQQAAKGLDIVMLGTAQYDSTMGIALLAESPIKTPKDLEGRKLGSTVTSGEYPFLPLFAKNAGLDLDKVQRVQLDAQVRNRALLSKEVDAISAFAGSSIPSIAVQNVDTRFLLYSKFGIPAYGLAVMTQSKRLADDPALCQAVVEASLEGLKLALTSPDEALEAYAAELKEVAMTQTGRDQVRIGFGMYALTTLLPEAKQGLGWQDPGAMKRQLELVMTYIADKADKAPDLDKIYSNRFVGGIKLTDAEWSAAEKRFAQYRKLIG
jgi:ABC-type nitrate/sulfonate/bicarbonate transport system substrate-binding protein